MIGSKIFMSKATQWLAIKLNGNSRCEMLASELGKDGERPHRVSLKPLNLRLYSG